MSGLLLGILALITPKDGYVEEEIQVEPTPSRVEEIEELFSESPLMASLLGVDEELEVLEREKARVERIQEIDIRIPEWVKERWTPEERRGGVILGPEEELWAEHVIERRVGRLTIRDV